MIDKHFIALSFPFSPTRERKSPYFSSYFGTFSSIYHSSRVGWYTSSSSLVANGVKERDGSWATGGCHRPPLPLCSYTVMMAH